MEPAVYSLALCRLWCLAGTFSDSTLDFFFYYIFQQHIKSFFRDFYSFCQRVYFPQFFLSPVAPPPGIYMNSSPLVSSTFSCCFFMWRWFSRLFLFFFFNHWFSFMIFIFFVLRFTMNVHFSVVRYCCRERIPGPFKGPTPCRVPGPTPGIVLDLPSGPVPGSAPGPALW